MKMDILMDGGVTDNYDLGIGLAYGTDIVQE